MLLHFFIILILVIKKSMSVAATNDELKDGKKPILQLFLLKSNCNISIKSVYLKM